jgi:LysM repeat protein
METENQKPQTGGLKLMTVFIAVLALHVIAIGGISAYHYFKGSGETLAANDKPEVVTETVEPKDAVATGLENMENASVETKTELPSPAVTPEETLGLPPEPAPTHVVQSIEPPTVQPPVVHTPAPAPVVSAGSSAEYTVKSGDSLYKIARQNHVSVAELKAANSLSSDNLKIGQKLRVPHKAGAPVIASVPAPVAPAPAVVTAVSSAMTYTVSKGDTLTKIARQFNTTAAALMAHNNISDARKLSIGTKLMIPPQAGVQRNAMSAPAQPAPQLKPQPSESSDLVMMQHR